MIRAGIWLRVSTAGQDEENQEPAILERCAQRGYDIVRRYVLHGKSASKGEQQAELDAVIADMQAGIVQVLVVFALDRLERRGSFRSFGWFQQVADAGGKVEFVTQPHLDDLTGMAGRLSLVVMSEMAAAESKVKSERVLAAHARIRANDGQGAGAIPFGFEVAGEKYAKQLTPTEEGRDLIPEVYARVIRGDSLTTVAKWLSGETGRDWWPSSIGRMVRREVYWREGLIPIETFRDAIASLEARPKRGPATGAKALLTGWLRCGYCDDSPMYKIVHGNKPGDKWVSYRCSGRGADRKGCGFMARLATLDGKVGVMMRAAHVEIYETRLVRGENHEAELELVRVQMAGLGALDLDDDTFDARMSELRAERDRLRNLPVTDDVITRVPTGETWSSNWRALEPDERRAWAIERGLVVRATREAVRIYDSGNVCIAEFISQDGHVAEEEA